MTRKNQRMSRWSNDPLRLLVSPKDMTISATVCGYSFKSTIPPQLIKCPDCMGKPKVVEEVDRERE
jgi:hypothetical protein